MLVLPQVMDMPWNQPRIAVLEIAGTIGVQVRGPEIVRAIKGLREDRRIAGVLADIDSNGGSAPVSDAIHRALKKLSAKKPTVAYIGSAGLSGGYLIACGASKIVALPTALVGSIGVIFMRPVVEELMEKVGVKMVVTHEGHLKGMFQPWHEPTPEEQQKVQALTEDYYGWFVDAVAKARGLPDETVRGYATGELYPATRAKEIGLVDELGDFEQALEMTAQMAKTPPRAHYVRIKRPLLERLLARGATAVARAMLAEAEGRMNSRIDYR